MIWSWADYLPRLKYLLIDENEVNPVDLTQMQNLMAAIIQVERPDSDQALQRLLAKRFGPLPSDAVQIISSASAEQVDAWLDRLLDAHSLDDVLRT
ncbi:MAG: DUF4351 domain-containing protein [Alcaligenaceae bacterium]|nr:DUF4351 domain-containing protein [Alcaligenaceae bacterium]